MAGLVALSWIDLHTRRLPREIIYGTAAVGVPLLVVAALVEHEPGAAVDDAARRGDLAGADGPHLLGQPRRHGRRRRAPGAAARRLPRLAQPRPRARGPVLRVRHAAPSSAWPCWSPSAATARPRCRSDRSSRSAPCWPSSSASATSTSSSSADAGLGPRDRGQFRKRFITAAVTKRFLEASWSASDRAVRGRCRVARRCVDDAHDLTRVTAAHADGGRSASTRWPADVRRALASARPAADRSWLLVELPPRVPVSVCRLSTTRSPGRSDGIASSAQRAHELHRSAACAARLHASLVRHRSNRDAAHAVTTRLLLANASRASASRAHPPADVTRFGHIARTLQARDAGSRRLHARTDPGDTSEVGRRVRDERVPRRCAADRRAASLVARRARQWASRRRWPADAAGCRDGARRRGRRAWSAKPSHVVAVAPIQPPIRASLRLGAGEGRDHDPLARRLGSKRTAERIHGTTRSGSRSTRDELHAGHGHGASGYVGWPDVLEMATVSRGRERHATASQDSGAGMRANDPEPHARLRPTDAASGSFASGAVMNRLPERPRPRA